MVVGGAGVRRNLIETLSSSRAFVSRKSVTVSVQLTISIVLIAVLAFKTDLNSLTAQIRGQSYGWLMLAAAVTLLQIFLAALRWLEVLRGLGSSLSVGSVLKVSFVGNFFNAWLLGIAGGDVIRAVLMPAHALGRAAVVYSVLFDRVAALAGLGLVILPITALGLDPLTHEPAVMISLAVAALPLLGLYAAGPALRILMSWRVTMASRLIGIGHSWTTLNRAWPRLLAALAVSAACVVAVALTAYCVARAQHLAVPFGRFLILIPPVVLLSSLPVSIGGWGVRESAMVIAMASVGVPTENAVLVSVQMGLLAAAMSIPGGFLLLVPVRARGNRVPVSVS